MSEYGRLDTDVFVVGGGPAGLCAAIAARQKGFRVVVADVVRPPIDKACGEGLMPDCLAELSRLGLAVEDCEHGVFRGIRFIGPSQCVEAEFPQGLGIGIRRITLHAALVRHAEACGVDMRWQVRVSAVRQGVVTVDGCDVTTRWIIGADGHNSLVRRWAGLNAGREFERRMALRQHFRTADVPDFVEIHWGEESQAYITPISGDEICVALMSKRRLGPIESELQKIPTLAERLNRAIPSSAVRGGVTVSNRLSRVYRGNIVLVGDASGSVDAITGEGLALSFRQAFALSEALAANDLCMYQNTHRQIEALPQFMRRSMLLMDKSAVIRHRALKALDRRPDLFARMLAVHVGELAPLKFGMAAVAHLGWRMLTA